MVVEVSKLDLWQAWHDYERVQAYFIHSEGASSNMT